MGGDFTGMAQHGVHEGRQNAQVCATRGIYCPTYHHIIVAPHKQPRARRFSRAVILDAVRVRGEPGRPYVLWPGE